MLAPNTDRWSPGYRDMVQVPNFAISASAVIAAAALVFNYISHRHTDLDSVFEREEKIDSKMWKIGDVMGNGLTEEEYEYRAKYIKSTVFEREEKRYIAKKLLWPTSDIEGRTRLAYRVEGFEDLDPSKYFLTDFEDDRILFAGLTIESDSSSLLSVEIDRVSINEVGNATGELDDPNCTIQEDKAKYAAIFSQ